MLNKIVWEIIKFDQATEADSGKKIVISSEASNFSFQYVKQIKTAHRLNKKLINNLNVLKNNAGHILYPPTKTAAKTKQDSTASIKVQKCRKSEKNFNFTTPLSKRNQALYHQHSSF